jgi:hypothetical protein
MAKPKASGNPSNESKDAAADVETASAEADFKAIEPRLKILPRDQLVAPNVDVQTAASVALGVARFLASEGVRKRFKNLAKSGEYDDSCVDDLPPVARAAWFARHSLLESTGTESTALLPVPLVDEATALRTRMFKCAEYHLGDDPAEAKRLSVIRAGQGYQDLANDLLGLSKMFARRKSDLAADKKSYRAFDAASAKKLANQILELLGVSGSEEQRRWTEMQNRAWTLLLQVYEEVARGGRFLYAHDEPDSLFPSLVAAARAKASREAAGAPEAPEVSPGEAPNNT